MPEFPEVNIQVQYLRQHVLGWRIQECQAQGKTHLKDLSDAEKDAACRMLSGGNVIEGVTQRGKQVIFRMKRGLITAHFMFKGRWSVHGSPFVSNYKRHRKEADSKHDSFLLINDAGQVLAFNDPDYRGHVLAYPETQDPAQVEALAKLGPEVLIVPETDPAFLQPWTLPDFQAATSRSGQAIKVFLLDQKRQSGIGNVYVCEALYQTKINPARPAKSLSEAETSALYDAVRNLMQTAIHTNLDYDQFVQIYKKETDPLGNPVTEDTVGGRDTYWVPAIQK